MIFSVERLNQSEIDGRAQQGKGQVPFVCFCFVFSIISSYDVQGLPTKDKDVFFLKIKVEKGKNTKSWLFYWVELHLSQ